jgi:diguanylate cyclase (GGDEF)-like protein/PAS domain S-box-containing protein
MRRDPVLLAVIAVTAVLTGWFLMNLGGDAITVRLFWAASPVADVLLWTFARRAAALPDRSPGIARYWRQVSWIAPIFLVGDASQAVYTWLEPAAPNLFQAACVLLGALWLIWTMLRHPAGLRGKQAWNRFWLDAAAILVGAAVLGWLVVPQSDPCAVVTAVLLLFAGFAAAKLILTGNPPMSTACAVVMVSGGALQVLSGLAAVGLHGSLAMQIAAAGLIAVGPRVHELTVGRPATVRRRRYSLMPYTTLIAMFALLPLVLRHGVGVDSWVVLCGLFVSTTLVVVRQIVAFAENSSLLDELAMQEDRTRSLLEHSTDITSIVDSAGRITYITPATHRVLGRTKEEVFGTPVTAYIHPDDLPAIANELRHLVTTPNAAYTYQSRYAHADGSWRWLDVISRNLSHVPSVGGVVSNARDVTQARILQDRLRHQATHDDLTGLANRALLDTRLSETAGTTSVLLVDLNDFKLVNDTHGHHVGDAVLVAVADRLRAVVPPGGTAARIGGDEFAVLLPDLDEATARQVGDRFLALLEEPVVVHQQRLRVRASVGIAEGSAADREALLRHADAAMYAAKRDARVVP